MPDNQALDKIESRRGLTRWIGYLAAVSWFLLAILTAGSSLLRMSTVTINIAIAVIFAAIALFVLWRARTIAGVARKIEFPDALGRLLMVEAATSAGFLIVGVLLLSGVASRVFGEGVPVFG